MTTYWTLVMARAQKLLKDYPSWDGDAAYLQARREIEAEFAQPVLMGVDPGVGRDKATVAIVKIKPDGTLQLL